MPKILIVDDEKMIRNVVKEYAEFEGYETAEAENGMEAVELCRKEDFDIIIMDIMMPRLDGYSAVKEIRKTKQIPVIMLSARGEEYDKLFGFEIGVDDYVVKPFSPKELLARIKAVLKRGGTNDETKIEKICFEGLEINITGREVTIDGKAAQLTPKEYDSCSILYATRVLLFPVKSSLRKYGATIFTAMTVQLTHTSRC